MSRILSFAGWMQRGGTHRLLMKHHALRMIMAAGLAFFIACFSAAQDGASAKSTGWEGDMAPQPDGDGSLLVDDWVLVGRFVAGLDVAAFGSEFQRGDCAPLATSGDGQILVNDWVQAGRYVAGLDTPRVQGGPTGEGESEGEVVEFPDANLKAIIRVAINKPSGDIYATDLMPLTELHVNTAGVADLEGMQYCINLRYLDLNSESWNYGHNYINDLGPLAGLTRLEKLTFDENYVTSLEPLRNLVNLSELTFWSNSVMDLAPLSGLTQMKCLNMEGNPITSVLALSNLVLLERLYMAMLAVTDLSPLSSIVSLKTLWIPYVPVGTLDFAAGLLSLEHLYADNIGVSDISPLSGLTTLVRAQLGGNRISDVSPLLLNPGLGVGDIVLLTRNPLSPQSCVDIETLRGRGVTIDEDTCGAEGEGGSKINTVIFDAQEGVLPAPLSKQVVSSRSCDVLTIVLARWSHPLRGV